MLHQSIINSPQEMGKNKTHHIICSHKNIQPAHIMVQVSQP